LAPPRIQQQGNFSPQDILNGSRGTCHTSGAISGFRFLRISDHQITRSRAITRSFFLISVIIANQWYVFLFFLDPCPSALIRGKGFSPFLRVSRFCFSILAIFGNFGDFGNLSKWFG